MSYHTIFQEAYAGKKVFLTGHTGFKGAWTLAWLNQLGAIVKGYALQADHPKSIYRLINGDLLCESVIADIRDKEKLKSEILSFEPDFIFHLAAQPLVRLSYEDPLYTYEVNVNGTAHVLEAVRLLDKPCHVVLITTDKVYNNLEIDYNYKETDRLGGYDPYSASKAAAEIVISSYRNSYFNPANYPSHKKAVAVARAGNVIGGGDQAKDRIIPDIIRALQSNNPVMVRNPASVRPWQHVLEPIAGYLLLGASLMKEPVAMSEAWNFGPENNDTLTVKEVVQKAIACWGYGDFETPVLTAQPHEAGLLKLDITKSKSELKWIPKFNSGEAVELTINWYKIATSENALEITNKAILEYQER